MRSVTTTAAAATIVTAANPIASVATSPPAPSSASAPATFSSSGYWTSSAAQEVEGRDAWHGGMWERKERRSRSIGRGRRRVRGGGCRGSEERRHTVSSSASAPRWMPPSAREAKARWGSAPVGALHALKFLEAQRATCRADRRGVTPGCRKQSLAPSATQLASNKMHASHGCAGPHGCQVVRAAKWQT
jgi:hypothetical protein